MIHLLNYISYGERHMNHWDTVVHEFLSGRGFDVNVINGTKPHLSLNSGLVGEAFYKTSQFENIFYSLITEGISDGDIIIVSDAWNPTMISLEYVKLVLGLDITIIAIWRDGIYDMNSKIRTGLLRKPKGWAKVFERCLYTIYDYNCFITENSKKRFFGRYNLKKDNPTTLVTGLPYGLLSSVREMYEPVEKEDIIVIPHDTSDIDQRDMIRALQNHLKDYTFIDSHELRLTDSEYYSILNRAKAVLAVNLTESDPTSIYEAMLFGCIPIIPDRLVYADVFQSRYFYPTHYTQPPFLNFVRGREFMHKRIDDVFRDYHKLSVTLDEDAKEIGNKFFNNEIWFDLIQNIGN